MLNSAQARTAIDRMIETARTMDLKPLTIVMLDAGGQVRHVFSEDGSPNNRFEVARGKANGALVVGSGSRTLNSQAIERPHFLAGLSSVVPSGIVPVPGGVIARDRKGQVVAAFGISGDSSDNDEAVAIAGITGIGLFADAGK